MTAIPEWWAEGTLFENCDCASVCPAHISFRQPCNHERCIGYWAIHIHEGRWEEADLSGLGAFIAYDAPQVMAEGGWIQEMYLDERAGESQRKGLESIIHGKAGSGWEVIAPFFETIHEIQYVPMEIAVSGQRFTIRIEGLLESTVEGHKGVNGESRVALENLPNKIHGPSHGLGLGISRFEGSHIRFQYDRTNAIFSEFSWKGP